MNQRNLLSFLPSCCLAQKKFGYPSLKLGFFSQKIILWRLNPIFQNKEPIYTFIGYAKNVVIEPKILKVYQIIYC